MDAWPGSLPQDVLVDGYDEQFPAGMLRTQMDAGPAKQRRRFTATVVPMSLQTDCDRTQVETLLFFFKVTLAMGALPFTWMHPRTLAGITFRFTKQPGIRPHPGAKLWRVTMDLEILP